MSNIPIPFRDLPVGESGLTPEVIDRMWKEAEHSIEKVIRLAYKYGYKRCGNLTGWD